MPVGLQAQQRDSPINQNENSASSGKPREGYITGEKQEGALSTGFEVDREQPGSLPLVSGNQQEDTHNQDSDTKATEKETEESKQDAQSNPKEPTFPSHVSHPLQISWSDAVEEELADTKACANSALPGDTIKEHTATQSTFSLHLPLPLPLTLPIIPPTPPSRTCQIVATAPARAASVSRCDLPSSPEKDARRESALRELGVSKKAPTSEEYGRAVTATVKMSYAAVASSCAARAAEPSPTGERPVTPVKKVVFRKLGRQIDGVSLRTTDSLASSATTTDTRHLLINNPAQHLGRGSTAPSGPSKFHNVKGSTRIGEPVYAATRTVTFTAASNTGSVRASPLSPSSATPCLEVQNPHNVVSGTPFDGFEQFPQKIRGGKQPAGTALGLATSLSYGDNTNDRYRNDNTYLDLHKARGYPDKGADSGKPSSAVLPGITYAAAISGGISRVRPPIQSSSSYSGAKTLTSATPISTASVGRKSSGGETTGETPGAILDRNSIPMAPRTALSILTPGERLGRARVVPEKPITGIPPLPQQARAEVKSTKRFSASVGQAAQGNVKSRPLYPGPSILPRGTLCSSHIIPAVPLTPLPRVAMRAPARHPPPRPSPAANGEGGENKEVDEKQSRPIPYGDSRAQNRPEARKEG
ncbi:hypothetical protein AAE478_008205 [Parahypoxylon ruwenzoriense]